MHLRKGWRDRAHSEAGFTLVELVITVAIVGIIVVALTGVVIEYLKVTQTTVSRMTESHDVQFASAYWQRDVASIGVRSTTYCQTTTTAPECSAKTLHLYPLKQSVAVSPNAGIVPDCSMPSGLTTVVTLAWSKYTSSSPTDTPPRVTVTYATQPSGSRLGLVRVRCTGPAVDSVATVADNIVPGTVQVACPGGCNGSGADVPLLVTMSFTSSDPANTTATAYPTTLTGDRRQT